MKNTDEQMVKVDQVQFSKIKEKFPDFFRHTEWRKRDQGRGVLTYKKTNSSEVNAIITAPFNGGIIPNYFIKKTLLEKYEFEGSHKFVKVTSEQFDEVSQKFPKVFQYIYNTASFPATVYFHESKRHYPSDPSGYAVKIDTELIDKKLSEPPLCESFDDKEYYVNEKVWEKYCNLEKMNIEKALFNLLGQFSVSPEPEMEVVTIRDLIRNFPDAWNKIYGNKKSIFYEVNEEKTQKINALNVETATVEEINDIIGNDTWTQIPCQCCTKRGIDKALKIKNRGIIFHLCFDCIDFMSKLIELAKIF